MQPRCRQQALGSDSGLRLGGLGRLGRTSLTTSVKGTVKEITRPVSPGCEHLSILVFLVKNNEPPKCHANRHGFW